MSVSTAEVDTHKSRVTGPVTSRSRARAAVEYTSTSLRCSAGRWSNGPGFSKSLRQQRGPPMVGTGFSGSYTNVSFACDTGEPGARESALSVPSPARSEEHTSELQSPCNLVSRLLL